MAVRIFTNSPKALLSAFDKKIAQEEREGSITTWEKTSQGFYTHKSERWGRKAYFKANAAFDAKLVFNVVPHKGKRVDPEVYSYYHGHLIEAFLNHFSDEVSSALATAKPTEQDRMVSATAT